LDKDWREDDITFLDNYVYELEEHNGKEEGNNNLLFTRKIASDIIKANEALKNAKNKKGGKRKKAKKRRKPKMNKEEKEEYER